MTTMDDTAAQIRTEPQNGKTVAAVPAPARAARAWLRAQSTNLLRHAAALRPFQRAEFGDRAEAPTEGHVRACNALLVKLRGHLLRQSKVLERSVAEALRDPTPANLGRVVQKKDRGHRWVRAVEQIWDFYLELFGQRQTRYGEWLLSCDRIALDCYQASYMGIGTARSIPAPPPFSYMRTGRSPATFRRGTPLRRLGKRLNPFPLIQLPFHRLVNPWTLGAVLHEVSHNLQNDLGLAEIVPQRIAARLLRAGFAPEVAAVWRRWNRETFADLNALLLGGPAVVESLMDVIARSPRLVMSYNPRGVHPTPYLRAFLSFELLRRLGFGEQAAVFQKLWVRMYGDPRAGSIPPVFVDAFPKAHRIVVATICEEPYPSLGDKSLSQVVRYGPKEQKMVEEAAGRLSAGTAPGVLPERFLIGACRHAVDRRLASPAVVTRNFYRALSRR